jgi:hypothetical protein
MITKSSAMKPIGRAKASENSKAKPVKGTPESERTRLVESRNIAIVERRVARCEPLEPLAELALMVAPVCAHLHVGREAKSAPVPYRFSFAFAPHLEQGNEK